MTVALLFYPTKSTPGHVNDAGYFHNNAVLAAKIWTKEYGLECHLVPFDNTLAEPLRRQFIVAQALPFAGRVSVVAFFCHGWTDGMQGGFARASVDQLADLLKTATVPGQLLRVVLYCCSTGSDRFGVNGDNSFADFLRDHASYLGVVLQVDCHTTPGDATENTHVRRMSSPAGCGGQLLADPNDHHFVELLRSTWRFRFPFKTREQITADVAATA